MVKFVASDLDGTLLLNGAQSVDESTIQYINKLVDKGVIFAPASGRQITSLKRLFGAVSDKLAYIAENGALVEYKGETIGKTAMDRKLALEIIEDVIEQPNCEVLVSGEHTSYIKPKSQEYYYRMTKVVNYHTTLVDKFTDIDEDILKIAVCDMTGNKSAILEKRKLEQFNTDFEKYEAGIYMEFNNSEWKKLSIQDAYTLGSSFEDIFNAYFGK